MKRILSIAMILVFIISLATISAFADGFESANEQNDYMEVIKNQLPEDVYARLTDKSEYEEPMDRDLSSKKILILYTELPWEEFHRPMEEVIYCTENAKYSKINYLVFSDEGVYQINSRFNYDSFVEIGLETWSYMTEFPVYISDIMNNVPVIPDLETPLTVTSIAVFGAVNMGRSEIEKVVYYATTSGTYVKVYPDDFSEAMLFTEEAFREYAAAYYAEKTSQWAEEDDPFAVSVISSFAEYMKSKNYTFEVPKLDVQPDNVDTLDEPLNPLYWIIPSAVAIIAVAGIGVFFYVKKRKTTKA